MHHHFWLLTNKHRHKFSPLFFFLNLLALNPRTEQKVHLLVLLNTHILAWLPVNKWHGGGQARNVEASATATCTIKIAQETYLVRAAHRFNRQKCIFIRFNEFFGDAQTIVKHRNLQTQNPWFSGK
jgi:hypothetical protein